MVIDDHLEKKGFYIRKLKVAFYEYSNPSKITWKKDISPNSRLSVSLKDFLLAVPKKIKKLRVS